MGCGGCMIDLRLCTLSMRLPPWLAMILISLRCERSAELENVGYYRSPDFCNWVVLNQVTNSFSLMNVVIQLAFRTPPRYTLRSNNWRRSICLVYELGQLCVGQGTKA